MTAAGMKPAVYLFSQEFLELDDAAGNQKCSRSHLMMCRPKTGRYR